MASVEKIENDVEVKSSADKFFETLSRQIHQVPNASSDKIHAVEVHEGDWEAAGSVKLWTYTIDGKKEILKEKVEIDEANKSLTMIVVEGHILEQYKSYKVITNAIPKGEGALVKITVVFEKIKAGDPPPYKYLDFVTQVVKDIGEHLVKG